MPESAPVARDPMHQARGAWVTCTHRLSQHHSTDQDNNGRGAPSERRARASHACVLRVPGAAPGAPVTEQARWSHAEDRRRAQGKRGSKAARVPHVEACGTAVGFPGPQGLKLKWT